MPFSIYDAHIHPTSKREIITNQTLFDWLLLSGGVHFKPDWDSKNEGSMVEGDKDGKKEEIKSFLKKSTDSHNKVICLTCVHFTYQMCLFVLSH